MAILIIKDREMGDRRVGVTTIDAFVTRAMDVNSIYNRNEVAIANYIKESVIGGNGASLAEYIRSAAGSSSTYDAIMKLKRYMWENRESMYVGISSETYEEYIQERVPDLFFRWNTSEEVLQGVKNVWEMEEDVKHHAEQGFRILGLDVEKFGLEYINQHPDFAEKPREHSYMGLTFTVPSPFEVEKLLSDNPRNENLIKLKAAVEKYAFQYIKKIYISRTRELSRPLDDILDPTKTTVGSRARMYMDAFFEPPSIYPTDVRGTRPIVHFANSRRDPIATFKRKQDVDPNRGVGEYWYSISSSSRIELNLKISESLTETIVCRGSMQNEVHSHYVQLEPTGSNSDALSINNFYPKKLAMPLSESVITEFLNKEEAEVLASFCIEALTMVEVDLPERKKPSWKDSFKEFFGALITVVSISFIPGVNFVGGVASVSVGTLAGAYLSNMAMKELTKIAVKLGIPPEAVAVLSTLITIQLGQGGGIGVNVGNLSNAKDMLKLVNMAVEVTQIRQQQQAIEIRKEVANFEVEKQKQMEELNKVQNLLDTGVSHTLYDLLVSPNVYGASSYNYLGESPEEFYTRTTIVDVGPITMDYIKSFADITSSLPRAVPYRIVEDAPVESVLLLN